MAGKDPRLVYFKVQRPKGKDWSIGLKRNIGIHLSSGKFVAFFDDDDLYAPVYLTTMMAQLEAPRAQVVKLSSWYILNAQTGICSFYHPIAWGLTQGKDEDDKTVRE